MTRVEFEKVRPLDRIPHEVFLAAAARAGQETGDETLAVSDLVSRRHGPGRLSYRFWHDLR